MSDLTSALGASIRIFLADGSADGVWVVEKSNWTGKALMAPRTRYKDLRARSDLDGPGVYLLSGPTESGVPAVRVYIGETDDLPGRLDSHNKSKDFWNRVIVFTSKDENLNKAHIRYLEARLISLAKAANRAELENGNVGSMPPLSEPDTAEAEAFLREMLLIYPVLGLLAFQRRRSSHRAPFGCTSRARTPMQKVLRLPRASWSTGARPVGPRRCRRSTPTRPRSGLR